MRYEKLVPHYRRVLKLAMFHSHLPTLSDPPYSTLSGTPEATPAPA